MKEAKHIIKVSLRVHCSAVFVSTELFSALYRENVAENPLVIFVHFVVLDATAFMPPPVLCT